MSRCRLAAYFSVMKMSLSSLAAVLALTTLWSAPSAMSAQTETGDEPDVVLASIEAPLTREALNAARLTLEEAGHSFRYGSFQFRPDGALVGVEIVLKVEGQEFHEYVEFVSESCILRLRKTEGPVMEGC